MVCDRRPRSAVLAAVFVATLFASLPVGARAQSARGQEKQITLDWIYKKKALGIEDPREFLPQELVWSPKGHLLAFLQKTRAHGRILVVVDPERPGVRDVVTAAQVREAVKGWTGRTTRSRSRRRSFTLTR
jgi:hypothetical protein